MFSLQPQVFQPSLATNPVIMHNSSGYDLHFLIKTLHKVNERFSIFPQNSEQFLALELGSFLFIDGFLNLGESLGVLAQNLRDKGKDSFTYTLKHSDPTKQDLLLQEGVFCYAYLDDFQKLDEKSLPPSKCFINDLHQEHISEGNYTYAQNIWKTFSCKTLGDYHDVYLKSDVLILTEVCENFRNFCLDHYGLDPAHFLTGSQLSHTALLNLTGVKLELLSDLDM